MVQFAPPPQPQASNRSEVLAYLLENMPASAPPVQPSQSMGEAAVKGINTAFGGYLSGRKADADQAKRMELGNLYADILIPQGEGETDPLREILAELVASGGEINGPVASAFGFGEKPEPIIHEIFDDATGRETKSISYDGGNTWQPFGGVKAKKNDPTPDIQNFEYGQDNPAFNDWRRTAGASNQTGVERIAAALMEEAAASGESLSYSKALQRAQRAPTDERDLVVRERLASEAARADQSNYIGDPEGTLQRWRDFYGLPAKVPSLSGDSRREPIAPKPSAIPGDAAYSSDLGIWFGDDGQFYDANGNPIDPPPGIQ